MVNVNKNIVPDEQAKSTSKPKASARRPRNRELNSSKKSSGQSRLATLRKQKLNCSAGNIPARYGQYYQVISEQEFADTVGSDVDNLREIVAEIEDEYGEKIVGYITSKPEYTDALVDANIDSGFITESGKILNGVDDGYITDVEIEQALGRELNSAVASGSSSSVNVEGALEVLINHMLDYSDRIHSKAYLDDDEAFVIETDDKYVKPITDAIRSIDGDDYDAFIAQPGIADIPVYYYYSSMDGDWRQTTMGNLRQTIQDEVANLTLNESLNSSRRPRRRKASKSSRKLNSSRMNSTKNSCMNCSEDDVVMITTESGNEVPLSEVKVIQNPSNNELMIYIPENGDDVIPEGFTVVYDVVQQDSGFTPDSVDPDSGEDKARLDSSYQNRAARRRTRKMNSSKKKEETLSSDSEAASKNKAANSDEHEMLVTCVGALEDTDNDLLVKETLFGDTDERPLRECLADWDEHEALVAVSEAIDDLMLGDEVIQSILGQYDPLDSDDFELDSTLEPITADVSKPKQQFQVYYEDENGNEIETPAVITISDSLEGMDLYKAIQEQFEIEYPGCSWINICDMNDEFKVSASRRHELNSSVHDNPALKLLVEKIKEVAKQVSTVPATEGGVSGYKIIIRGMEPAEIEPIAAEFGIQLSSVKPLEDGFAVVVDNDSLSSSEVDPNDEGIVDDGAMRYKDYLITGGEKSGGYIAVSPYGKFSPHIYKTVDECKAAIDKDIKFRFSEQ